MVKKLVKVLLILGVLLLASWVVISLYQKEVANDKNNQFFMLEINANNKKILIEPHKNKAVVNDKEIKLEENALVSFISYFNDYFPTIKNMTAKESTKYLWTIKYQDVNLNNFSLGNDNYPADWQEFAKKVDRLLGGVYLTKREDIKEEEDLSVKAVTTIDFLDTCNAYTCNYSLKIGNDIIPLTFRRTISMDDTFDKQSIVLNKKTIINENFQSGGPIKLKVFKDKVIILCGYGDGTAEISAYDVNGNKLFSYDEIDELYPGLFVSVDDFELGNNYIKVETTRLTVDNKIRINGVTEVNPCDEIDLQDNGIDSSVIVKATYKINYINNRFDSPVVLNTTTLLKTGLMNKCENTSE